MENKELIELVVNELNSNKDVIIDYEIEGEKYKIIFMAPNEERGINISSILMVPRIENINNQITLESNNLESENLSSIIEQASFIGMRLANLTKDFPCPIVIPLIPSYKDSLYFQQLSKECFKLTSSDKNYRMDEQVVKVIELAKKRLETEWGIVAKEKIFLSGYSSSGVFAQRFALLHPEVVETVCIGGASGSIPIPSDEIGYPIGIKDYENLFGYPFRFDVYKSIVFRYYVGELEAQNKSKTRLDDNGNPAPIHDMSYFDRSIPTDIGKKQRSMLGNNLLFRAEKTVSILKSLGIDIEHIIIQGREHGNSNGIGVNELGDKFIIDTYHESFIMQNIKNNIAR